MANEENEEKNDKFEEQEEIDEKTRQIAERSSALDLFIRTLIAQRILQMIEDGITITEEQMEADLLKIAKQMHLTEVLTKADTNRLLEEVLKNTYKSSKMYFEYAGRPFVPFDENEPIQAILEAFKTDVANSTDFQTQGYMIRDPKDKTKLIPTPVSEMYKETINKAAEDITNGLGDVRSAVRETVKELAEQGLKTVDYESESGRKHSQSTEAAVERNIQDNIRDINQQAQNELGDQYGADGKEITVHEHSAPDHEPIQGHQFTNAEYEKLQNSEPFEDVKGRNFSAIKRHIGQYNCRHFAYSIILGINKPNFTDEELQANMDRNQKGYTDENGKHRTMYECTQEQRRLEREIRHAKQAQMVAKEAGDMELARKYQMRINDLVEQYKEFSEACGLPIKGERLYVVGYKPIKI